jgi:nicotinate dehydrogenase subunit B
MDVNGGLNANGSPAAYDFATIIPRTARRHWHCCSPAESRRPGPCSRWATAPRFPPYDYEHMRVGRQRHAADRVRVVASRRLGAAEHFAHESYIDELATKRASIRSNIGCAI